MRESAKNDQRIFPALIREEEACMVFIIEY
jgi:hypothetical protein